MGDTPFDIANPSDPFFVAFQNSGFDSIRSSLIEANAAPDSIGRCVSWGLIVALLEKMLIENPSDRINFQDLCNEPYVQ